MARAHGERQQDYLARSAARTRGELVTSLRMSLGMEIGIPPACECRGKERPHLHAEQIAAMSRNVAAAERAAGWSEKLQELFGVTDDRRNVSSVSSEDVHRARAADRTEVLSRP